MLKGSECHTVDSKSLARWAAEEMKVPGITAKTDLSFICRGEMCNIWQDLIKNVTSRETAKLIHGNIQLQKRATRLSGTGEDNLRSSNSDSKLTRYKLLQEQLSQGRRELSKLENAIRRDEAELSANSITVNTTLSRARDAKIKACLFTQHTAVLNKHTDTLYRFETSLRVFIDRHILQLKEESFFSSLKSESYQSTPTASLAQARVLKKAVADFLQSLLEGGSKQSLQEDHAKIKKLLTELMHGAGSEGMLSGITHDTVRGTTQLDEETAMINYEKDAERLRFRVVNEGFVDESKEPSLLQGARELMEERQLDHQEMFLNTEKCKVESNALRKKATKLREILFSCPSVEARMTNRAAIIMEVIDNTVAARRMRAARDITHSVVAELQKQVKSSSEQLASLKQKEAAIASFKSNVQSKQKQICSLMKQNMSSRDKLESRQMQIKCLLCTMREEAEPLDLLATCSVLTNHASEIRQLCVLPLHCLSSNNHSVIRGIHGVGGKSGSYLQCFLRFLNFQYFTANDAFLLTLLRKRNEVLQSYMQARALPCREELQLSDHITNKHLPEMRQHICSMLKVLLPVLQDSKEAVKKGHRKCDRIHQLIDEWWHQPALKLDLSV